MSDYNITAEDLRTRFTTKELAQLTTDPPGATPDDAVIDAAIVAAEAEIHMAAGVYYATPIVPVEGASQPQIAALTGGLREKILDFAAYKLLQRRPSILNSGERSVYWSQLRKSIDTWLERLQSSDQSRRIALPAAALRSTTVSASGDAWAESEENAMSFDLTRRWR